MQSKGLAAILPITAWLPKYQHEWLTPDVLAGLALWAVMVPEGMAYAGIVGVPPIMGLYTLVSPLFVYALLGPRGASSLALIPRLGSFLR
jgi:MFS superfamily sulfate permease-like transporter